MPINNARRRLHSSFATLLLVICCGVSAQGFDPSKVDWEALSKIPMRDGFIRQFNEDCAVCHGEDLRGAMLGTPLVGVALRHGDSVREIAQSIANGFPDRGMPAWTETLDDDKIWNLALYVAEQRQGTTILDKRDDIPLEIPTGTIVTERESFRIETVASGLDPMPFSIAPLPDGGFLLTERMRGLSLIDADGTRTLIEGTPPAYDDAGEFLGQVMGIGWTLGVALHPDYEDNGWIYLHHTDRCSDCNELSRKSGRPVSMNRLIRGRIRDGQWRDEQVIWQAAIETYTDTSDLAAGGRISFDADRHVFISLGM
jgi:cytochrome c553